MRDKNGLMDNNPGKIVPNYSKIPSVNRAFSTVGQAGADRVEALLAQGFSNGYICETMDGFLKHAYTDTPSMVRAIANAISSIENMIPALEEGGRKIREGREDIPGKKPSP